MNPNKNFNAIIHALDYIEFKDFLLVIAGGLNFKIFNSFRLIYSEYVRYIGYVSDEELKALYINASGFVYPSLYEGFGFPPLEAMTCGCPVIVSKAASLPEVCGDAALFCDPNNPKDISSKIESIITDQKLYNELKRKGLERSNRFSWEQTAQETLAAIINAL